MKKQSPFLKEAYFYAGSLLVTSRCAIGGTQTSKGGRERSGVGHRCDGAIQDRQVQAEPKGFWPLQQFIRR